MQKLCCLCFFFDCVYYTVEVKAQNVVPVLEAYDKDPAGELHETRLHFNARLGYLSWLDWRDPVVLYWSIARHALWLRPIVGMVSKHSHNLDTWPGISAYAYR